MTRLALVLPSLASGGAERVTITLARQFCAAGIETHLIVVDARGPLAAALPKELRIHDLGHARLRSAIPTLIRTLRHLAPCAVLSTFGYVNLVLAAGRVFLPRKTCIVLREANLPSLSLPRTPHARLFRVGYRILYPLTDRILCSSEAMRREFERDFGISEDRLTALPNPVEISTIRRHAATIRRQAGQGRRFVASGRLVPQKGFDRLVELMSSMSSDTRLAILGDGPERERLRQQIAEAGLSDRIDLVGFAENPWGYYAGADAVVLPSRWEGMPNVALEALACGTPVIATPETGGLAELISETPLGAVTIEPFGAKFRDALTSTPTMPIPTLRPSLLPDRFHAERVAEAFCRMVLPPKSSTSR